MLRFVFSFFFFLRFSDRLLFFFIPCIFYSEYQRLGQFTIHNMELCTEIWITRTTGGYQETNLDQSRMSRET